MYVNIIGKFCFYDLLQFIINISKFFKLVNIVENQKINIYFIKCMFFVVFNNCIFFFFDLNILLDLFIEVINIYLCYNYVLFFCYFLFLCLKLILGLVFLLVVGIFDGQEMILFFRYFQDDCRKMLVCKVQKFVLQLYEQMSFLQLCY